MFLLGIFGLFTTNLFAQEDATIDPADIKFWIGEGENEVVFIANWAEPDTALAWGYRFMTENVTIKTIMDDITAADYRFSYEATEAGWLVDMHFNDGVLDLSLVQQMWVSFLIDGQSCWDTFDVALVYPGQYVKLGDTECGTLVDPVNYIYVWEKEVAPVYALGEEATIDPSEILYWIGEGDNEVVFAVNFAEPEDVCYAWGYRTMAETVTVKDIMDDIAAADYRFSYEATDDGWLVDMHYNDGVLDLSLVQQMWVSFLIDGQSCWDTYDVAIVTPGQYVKLGDTECGTLVDPVNYIYVWEKEVAPVYALGEEAMIDPSEILYWVGEGENEVVFCVNWNEPNVALAWGYRFDGESIIVKEVMDGIAAADSRFSYELGDWGIGDIKFDEGETHLALVGDYWWMNVNGYGAWYGYDEQTLVNGDFLKWGDISCATEVAEWTYVWTAPVIPVTVWTAVEEVEAATLSVYPNPATEMLYVNAENLKSVEIYDILGHNVLSTTTSVVDLFGIEAGVYFVTVRTENAAKTTKLVVK